MPASNPFTTRPEISGRFEREVYAELDRCGHRLDVYGDYDLGYVTAATRDDGILRAGASPRAIHCYATER